MPLFKKDEQPRQPNLEQLLSEFNRSLTLIVDKSLLIGNIVAKVKQICPVESVYIFLLDENTGKFKQQNEAKNKPVTLTNRSRLISWLSVNEKHLIISRHPDIVSYFPPEEQEIIRQLGAELIFPLKIMNQINGTIFLGMKTDGAPFTEQELNLLSILINQATFAIEHASLYEQQTERLKKMYRTDRLATLGELAAGAAHEIRNPLTAIRSTIQYLSKDFSADPVKSEMVTELISEVERINKIVQGLLSFARPSDLNTSDINIEQLINQTLLLVTNTLRKQNVEVEFEYFTDNTTIQGDAEQLKQVFLNIILNAVEAMGKNPPERSRTLIISIEKGTPINTHSRYLIISFEDSGKGIEQKNIENVFNPFFTTKEEGTGLGLAICYGIINRHEGEIEVKSVPDKGTCMNIKLPQRI
ncbi:ATP-binding protein [Parabacteroides segnis]|jgi:two-component system, NtrC family, sensor kinase|uniref:histidine kinase n=1 Tax=Parabacteroides segnis TaxID=2763058 RepID=A0ABR7E8G2_9BACT|nr:MULTISPECIES: GAF domain-containing sensor histidine kinase [Parabacteroides]MBC5645938.1 GAF domain-containing protein [Parabacteroides segnis]MCM0715933.1 ATP-binding protein [Parabacteroides sp. TA-V-105]